MPAHVKRVQLARIIVRARARPSLGLPTRTRFGLSSHPAKVSRPGKLHSQRNRTWGQSGRTERGSPRVSAPARDAARCVRKGRGSGPHSLRGNESSKA